MNKFISFAAAAVLVAALPAAGFAATTHIANSANSKLCSADAPESYKRPGGFCDQIDNLKSLHQNTERECPNLADAGFVYDETKGMLVAYSPSPCCYYIGMGEQPLPAEGILVADNSCY